MKNEEIAGLFAKKRNRYKGGIKSMTLIKAKKQRSKPQAPSNYKLRCTNDFVFKSLMTYDPEIGKRLVKDLDLTMMVRQGDFSELTARNVALKYAKNKDVVVCASDLMAIGAMNALIDMDIFRPVCGFDGIT